LGQRRWLRTAQTAVVCDAPVYADRLLTVQPEGEDLVIFACNDSTTEWQGDFELLCKASTEKPCCAHRLNAPSRRVRVRLWLL
jgi:hypothetical protein